MQYRITKIEKYGKGCYTSEKIGVQYYFVVHTRVYVDEARTRYFPIRFMIMFDGEDICEAYDCDAWTREDVKNYKYEVACSAADCIIGCNSDRHQIVREANATIERYAA